MRGNECIYIFVVQGLSFHMELLTENHQIKVNQTKEREKKIETQEFNWKLKSKVKQNTTNLFCMRLFIRKRSTIWLIVNFIRFSFRFLFLSHILFLYPLFSSSSFLFHPQWKSTNIHRKKNQSQTIKQFSLLLDIE